jgi:hypothetical protein
MTPVPQRPRNAPGGPMTMTQPISHPQLLAPQAVITTLSPFPPHPQVQSDASDAASESINQVLQEIRTLERIANRLNDLYSLRDRLIRRGSHRR